MTDSMPPPDKASLLARVKPHRVSWDPAFRPPGVQPAGPGEESVWDYPRPPIVAPAPGAVRVMCGKLLVAETTRALEVKETAGAPVPYLPPEDVRTDWLSANGDWSVCEWKGAAAGHDLLLPSGERIADAAWTYPDPFDDLAEGYAAIAGWFAFYPARLACFIRVDEGCSGGGRWERARPQPGGVYGGWVTGRIKGPVKGAPGSEGW